MKQKSGGVDEQTHNDVLKSLQNFHAQSRLQVETLRFLVKNVAFTVDNIKALK